MMYYFLAAVGLLFVIQLLYLFLIYKIASPHSSPKGKGNVSPLVDDGAGEGLPRLSVIITACNQDYLLRQNLPAVLEQDYPDFEVIVVDDNSTDETTDILQQLQNRYPRLRTTFVPPTSRRISHRKLALTLGIKAATGDWLVFTDADCRPAGNLWLRSLTGQTADDCDAVVGFTGVETSRGLGALVRRFDAQLRGLRLLGLAARGRAHMAYGTNMMYRRSIFFDAKGYSSHLNLERGDDDIFVNEHIAPRRIRAAITPEAKVVCTDTSRRHWRLERMGRLATRRHLRGVQKALLTFDSLTRVLYIIGTLAAIVMAVVLRREFALWWVIVVAAAVLWVVRYVLSLLVWNRSARALGDASYGAALPVLMPLQMFAALGLRVRYIFTSKQRYRRKQL